MRLRARIHSFFLALVAEHRAPGRVAAAIVVGAMVGCTPLFGFHIVVCLALAWLLRLNKVIVYAAGNVSIPPLIPFVGFASVQLGERLRFGRFLPLTLDVFKSEPARKLAARFFWSWMVGGTLLGAMLGVLGSIGVLLWLRRRVERGPIDVAIETAWRAYDREPDGVTWSARIKYRTNKWYARVKYRTDPCYRAIAAHIAPGTFTVDLGTGLGMLPLLLGTLGERRALGVEWDVAKAEAGQRATKDVAGVQIIVGDVRVCELPACDVITLVDVLHYYDDAEQRALLTRCAAAAPTLLIREGDGARRGGSRVTRVVESTVTKLGWNRGPKVRFRPIVELEEELRTLGFSVTRDEVAGKLHPGNVLLIATRGG